MCCVFLGWNGNIAQHTALGSNGSVICWCGYSFKNHRTLDLHITPIVMGLNCLINQRTYSAKIRTEGTYICCVSVDRLCVCSSVMFSLDIAALSPGGFPQVNLQWKIHMKEVHYAAKKHRNYLLAESVRIFILFFMWIIHCIKFGSLNRNWSKKTTTNISVWVSHSITQTYWIWIPYGIRAAQSLYLLC